MLYLKGASDLQHKLKNNIATTKPGLLRKRNWQFSKGLFNINLLLFHIFKKIVQGNSENNSFSSFATVRMVLVDG